MNTTKTVPNDFQIQQGTTWIGGPTNELQRQHIPGYAGHVHGLTSENVHGKNFARVTGQCLNQRNSQGIDLHPQEKFRTSYQDQFPKPDLRTNQLFSQAEQLLVKLQNTQQAINHQMWQDYMKRPKSIQEIAPIDRMPVVGYQGFRPVYRKPQKQVQTIPEPTKFQFSQTKILREMIERGEIDQKILQKINKSEPIVGYGGFLKGIKSGNQYGRTFNELARTSVRK